MKAADKKLYGEKDNVYIPPNKRHKKYFINTTVSLLLQLEYYVFFFDQKF